MIRLLLITADELRELPEGAVLTGDRPKQRMVWQRAYSRPHPDPDTGLWTLPRNPFADWQVAEIEAELPDEIELVDLDGDEPWLSTLDHPHDTTRPH